jgi:replication-associated recombination protein RarA
MLNALEIAVDITGADGPVEITREVVREAYQTHHYRYDRGGEEHYNTISAFIKSVRGSDPDAAVYYLARMLEAGEDPKFIARRLIVLASEDIGNAEPYALTSRQPHSRPSIRRLAGGEPYTCPGSYLSLGLSQEQRVLYGHKRRPLRS